MTKGWNTWQHVSRGDVKLMRWDWMVDLPRVGFDRNGLVEKSKLFGPGPVSANSRRVTSRFSNSRTLFSPFLPKIGRSVLATGQVPALGSPSNPWHRGSLRYSTRDDTSAVSSLMRPAKRPRVSIKVENSQSPTTHPAYQPTRPHRPVYPAAY